MSLMLRLARAVYAAWRERFFDAPYYLIWQVEFLNYRSGDFVFKLDPPFSVSGEMRMSTVTLQVGQKVRLRITPHTRSGREGRVEEGSVMWESSSPAAWIQEDERNELSAIVEAKEPGEAVIAFSADADLGEGVREVRGIGTIIVAEEDVTTFELNFGTPFEGDEPAGEPGPTAQSFVRPGQFAESPTEMGRISTPLTAPEQPTTTTAPPAEGFGLNTTQQAQPIPGGGVAPAVGVTATDANVPHTGVGHGIEPGVPPSEQVERIGEQQRGETFDPNAPQGGTQ